MKYRSIDSSWEISSERKSDNLLTGFPSLDYYIGNGIKRGNLILITCHSKFYGDAIALQKSIAENISKENEVAYFHKQSVANGLSVEGLLSCIDIINTNEFPCNYDLVNEILYKSNSPLIKSNNVLTHHIRKRCFEAIQKNTAYSLSSNILSSPYMASLILSIDDNVIKIEKNRFGPTGQQIKVEYDQINCVFFES